MIGRNANDKHRPRRIVLLSSAAGLALALLIAGPGGYLPLRVEFRGPSC